MAKKKTTRKKTTPGDSSCAVQPESLGRLVEQAASKITLLDPSDSSEMQNFTELFEQIQSAVRDCSTLSEEQADQCNSLVTQSSQEISELLKAGAKDSDKTLNRISEAITELQGITEELVSQVAESVSTDSSLTESLPEEPQPPTVKASQEQAPAEASSAFMEEDIPLIQDFIAESNEHIETAESSLLDLENQPENEELLNQIFRGFHTIKGMAGFLNLDLISTLAHASENLLDQGRKGNLKIVGATSDVAFKAIDMLKRMIKDLDECLKTSGPLADPPDLKALINQLEAAAEGKLQESESDAPEPIQQDRQLDSVLLENSAPKASTAARNIDSSQQEKIKVSTRRLDDLINMTGELSVAQLMISEAVKNSVSTDNDLFRKVALQTKIVRELQELSMAMRMIPIQGAFQRMTRLVRDLSRKAKKDIQLITFGEETELDRNIVDKITDPLIHMMRNSVDHGIETAEDRKGKNKSPHGTIRLSAFHQAGNIVVEIRDDGKGLNREKIIAKARERGLCSEGQDLTDEEAFKMIFHPGFSTADKVTDVSGRGVGMDVVRKNIEALGGKIDIHSILDQGTTFTIRLPLTLAIIDGQIVTVGQQRYIVPINSVVQSIRPTADQISTVQDRGKVVMLRGELIPLLSLYELFNVPNAVEDPQDGLLMIVADSSRKCCLQVDNLLGQQQIVIKNLSGLGKIKGISGGSIMGDGRVSLILDIPGLLEIARQRGLEYAGELV